MKMLLNTLHRTLCVNKGKVSRPLWVSSVNETHKFYISKKFYNTLDTSLEYGEKKTVNKLNFQNLYNFRKMRYFLIKNRNYDSTSTRKLDIRQFSYSKVTQSIKSINWFHLTEAEIMTKCKLLSVNAAENNERLTDEKYREIILALIAKCWKFTDNELHTLLQFLELWPDIKNNRKPQNPVRKLLERIDKELNKRSNHWSIDKTLMYCDTICRIFGFESHFVLKSLSRITAKPSTLSYTNIVQIMYYLFIYSIPKSLVRPLESYIEDYFDKFTIEELGIICSGFFRSQVNFTSDKLLYKLMQKLIDDVNNINSSEMGSFFKMIRYSFISKTYCVKKCEEVLEMIIPRVPDMSDPVLTHLSHLMADAQICNPALFTAIIKRFIERIRKLRLKDIDRMIFFLTVLNIPSTEPVYDFIIKELESSSRCQEKKKFPREFSFALRHLALVNIYPLQLISMVMSPEHMRLGYGPDPYNLGVEYLILDQSIEIEVPQYTGPRLENSVCNFLTKKYDETEAQSFSSESRKQMIQTINNLFNSEHATCLQRILPHFFQKDIILCLDKDNNAIPPRPMLQKINSLIKRVPKEFENLKWIAIIFATETYFIRGTNQFTGNLSAKIRHLEKVGYVSIVVHFREWKVLYTDSQKREYLKKKMSVSIDS